MRGYTDSMIRLAEAFGRLPGIGQKTAERLTYYVLRAPREEMAGLFSEAGLVLEAALRAHRFPLEYADPDEPALLYRIRKGNS